LSSYSRFSKKEEPQQNSIFENTLYGSLSTNLHPDPVSKPEMYDLSAYNDMIVKNFKIYDPFGHRIETDVHGKLLEYCTCHKNPLNKVGTYSIE
jgi:hypothetical protein